MQWKIAPISDIANRCYFLARAFLAPIHKIANRCYLNISREVGTCIIQTITQNAVNNSPIVLHTWSMYSRIRTNPATAIRQIVNFPFGKLSTAPPLRPNPNPHQFKSKPRAPLVLAETDLRKRNVQPHRQRPSPCSRRTRRPPLHPHRRCRERPRACRAGAPHGPGIKHQRGKNK